MPENNSTIDINEVMKHYLLCAIWTEEEQMSEMEEKEIADFYGESEEITKLVPRNEMNIENSYQLMACKKPLKNKIYQMICLVMTYG